MNEDNIEYENYWERRSKRESYTYWGVYAAFIAFGLAVISLFTLLVLSEYRNMQYREACRKADGIVLTLETSPSCFKSSIFQPVDPR